MESLNSLRTLIARHCPDGRRDTAIPRVTLMSTPRVSTPVPMVYEPRLSLVAQGAKRVELGELSLEYDAGRFLLVSIDVPVCSAVSEASEEKPFQAFSLKLDPAALAGMLLEFPPAAKPLPPEAGIATHPLTAELIAPVVRLLSLLDTPSDIAALAPLIEREILYRLIRGGQGEMLRQIAQANSRLNQIGRAIAWIRGHYAQPLRIDALAAIAAMSPSSLHRHFKAVTALSPLQYQKRIRLLEARRLLLARQSDAASISFAVGYESPSQFSREYHRLFGAPPIQDQSRMLAA
ncbi:AraC family transcriptional regulator N-terminal domain-containing protein [Niveibacterium terrae]|uniref:AraC family transcriptional regulator n=1 Tax=Niveibacterium terrae TaxID=3373598 RepID=UPI003A95224F